jgi:DNA-binding response OmpR family regulator
MARDASPWTFVLNESTRILVVDDDPILREFARVHLATPLTTIDTVGDGEAALLLLRKGPYDVVVLDIEMPRLDGISLLTRMRADEALRRIPVIMLTGHDDITSIDRSYQAGASSFASKPVNWRQLSYQIRYVIRASRLEGGADPRRDDRDAAAPERQAGEFLQSVIARATALAGRLAAAGRPGLAQLVRSVCPPAQQALAEHAAAHQVLPESGDRAA